MSLFKNEDIIEKIKEMDEKFHFKNLTCWVKAELKYNIYIFSIYCDDESNLTSSYTDLRDYIALYFQSQILTKDVERWNVYIYFLVGSYIEPELKFSIEQDKYSSRKIIRDSLGEKPSLDDVSNFICSDIFQLEITEKTIEDIPLEESLCKRDNDLLSLIEEYDDEYLRVNLENVIEELCHDQN
ncbi:ABC-three component system middle component 1 [Vibrio splendidus]|uniref:ABC-three component system middle component 1 n=1 Tax=Vibrio splendidus TaxID=29497 RepID=UPI00036C0848|nr:ABC-three component system middle component 1 [Vibrio splendidus]OEF78594.1 hypothetical protein A148_14065 [Vibrio splendidus 1F-157]